jgi:hypothetical protein
VWKDGGPVVEEAPTLGIDMNEFTFTFTIPDESSPPLEYWSIVGPRSID